MKIVEVFSPDWSTLLGTYPDCWFFTNADGVWVFDAPRGEAVAREGNGNHIARFFGPVSVRESEQVTP